MEIGGQKIIFLVCEYHYRKELIDLKTFWIQIKLQRAIEKISQDVRIILCKKTNNFLLCAFLTFDQTKQ
jgi:hypothetical protein